MIIIQPHAILLSQLIIIHNQISIWSNQNIIIQQSFIRSDFNNINTTLGKIMSQLLITLQPSPNPSDNNKRSLVSSIKKTLLSKGYIITEFQFKGTSSLSVSVAIKVPFLEEFELLITSQLIGATQIKTEAQVIYNGMEFVLKNKAKCSVVASYLSSIAPFYKLGFISLHPLAHRIVAVSFYNLDQSIVQRLGMKRIMTFVTNEIEKMNFQVKIVFYKILYLIGYVDEIFFDGLDYECNLIRKHDECRQELGKVLTNLVWRTRKSKKDQHPAHLLNKERIEEFQNHDAKPKKVDKTGYIPIMDSSIKKMQKEEESTDDSRKSRSTRTSTTQSTKSTAGSKGTVAVQILEDLSVYNPYLRQYPFPRIPHEKVGIFTEIVFQKGQNLNGVWNQILGTKTITISSRNSVFKYKQPNGLSEKPVPKFLIKKTFVENNAKQRFQQQVRILKHLSQRTSVNIGKFYFTNEQGYQESILMDLIAESSVDVFWKKNWSTISLDTKLALLYPIGQGIRFLRDTNVIHLDLKFQNVLIARGLIPKITDFGESIIYGGQQSREQEFKKGCTFPYVSYENFAFSRVMKNVHPPRDTYSFGVMIDYLLMDRHLLPFRRSSQQNLKKYLQQIRYLELISFTPQRYLNLLSFDSMSLIWSMVLLQMHPERKQRPNLDVVVIVLKLVQKYLDEITT